MLVNLSVPVRQPAQTTARALLLACALATATGKALRATARHLYHATDVVRAMTTQDHVIV